MSQRMNSVQSRRFWVLSLVTLAYLLAFMQRTGPGVIANQLQAQFHVTAAVLGTMSSIQYLLYMILQVPVGLSGDKFGPERLLAIGVMLDGIGTLTFSVSHAFVWLLVGRAIVGLGDALIWVNIVLILGRWFLPQQFGMLLAIVSTGGNFGALLTTLPFAAWVSVAGWRIPFTILGCALAVVSLAMLWVFGRGPDAAQTGGPKATERMRIERIPVKRVLALVVRDRVSWATFCCHFGAVGTYLGFVGLWAVPYFMGVYHVSRSGATFFTLAAFVGGLIGGPLAGAVSDRMGQRRLPYVVFQAATTVAWGSFVIAGGKPPEWMSVVAMFILGLGSGGSLLTFAVIRDVTPKERSGVTSGFANTGGFLSAVLLPVVFGFVLDAFLPAGHANTSPGPLAFAAAFIVPTLFSAVGTMGSLLIREKSRNGLVQVKSL